MPFSTYPLPHQAPQGPRETLQGGRGVLRASIDRRRRSLRSSNTIPSDGKDPAAKALGKKGGVTRAKSMMPERGDEIAKKAAVKRGGRKMLLRCDRLDVFFFETHQEHSIFRHRGFWSEVQRVYENRIWTSLPSSLRIPWNGVLKPKHFLGVRLAVMTMSWISSSDSRSMSM